ncbi:MAG TPA: hypothetical protein VNY29_18865 [Terriglobales bacterium]|nr:hypothetical protein [Terriglobales bacterium]
MKNYPIIKNVSVLALLAVLGVLIAGYHPGAEDDEVYLAAIQHDLNPVLFPHDADFFAVQLQATIFDKVVAGSARVTHVPVSVVVLAWHCLAIFLVLWGCLRVSRRCFEEPWAQWASATLVAVLLTLPVAGSALYLVDQNLHPRALATAAILAAIVATLDRKYVLAGGLLVGAAAIHPIMASFGISFCVFLGCRQPAAQLGALALAPLGWIFEPTSSAWRAAAETRDYYFLARWQWYEWLGVIAPFAVLWWFRRMGQREGRTTLARVAERTVWYGAFQLAVALMVMTPRSLERLWPLQPMRYLHLLYLLMTVLGGGVLGQKILRAQWWRWLVLFVPLAVGMFFAQRATYPASAHLEWPGAASRNAWREAFAWIRANTPTDSYFALGANYMRRPGENYHGFRALAERSRLADATKDSAVATQVPTLAARWQEEVQAQRGWEHFGPGDFQRLKARFGVDWVVVEQPGVSGLVCPYQNSALLVCRLD